MIKKIAILIAAALLSGFLVPVIIDAVDNPAGEPVKVNVSKSEKLNLDFNVASVRVVGWDRDYAEVYSSVPVSDEEYIRLFGKKYDILTDNNSIRLKNFRNVDATVYHMFTWPTVSQFNGYEDTFNYSMHPDSVGVSLDGNHYQFIIRVPKNTPVTASAANLKFQNCTVAGANANTLEIRDSTVVKGFEGNGGSAVIRNSKISRDIKMNYVQTEKRDNRYTE